MYIYIYITVYIYIYIHIYIDYYHLPLSYDHSPHRRSMVLRSRESCDVVTETRCGRGPSRAITAGRSCGEKSWLWVTKNGDAMGISMGWSWIYYGYIGFYMVFYGFCMVYSWVYPAVRGAVWSYLEFPNQLIDIGIGYIHRNWVYLFWNG